MKVNININQFSRSPQCRKEPLMELARCILHEPCCRFQKLIFPSSLMANEVSQFLKLILYANVPKWTDITGSERPH